MIATRDEATAAVLGAVLLSDTSLDVLLEEGIRPEHFHREHERAIYATMLHLRDAGGAVDELTLKARFASPQSPVGPADVDRLATAVPNLGNLRGYCRIVRHEAHLEAAERALHRASDALANRDLEGIVAAVAALDAPDPSLAGPVDSAQEFIDWYETDQGGLALPFPTLTESIGGGLQPGEVTVIGGWSSMGKSFLLKDLLVHARSQGARCHEFANEMHGPRRTARLVCSLTGIPEPAIRKRQLTKDQWAKVLKVLGDLPYESTPTAGWRVEDYCRAIRKGKWDVCAIDTVTNLPCSRVDEWDRACVMLADAAAQSGTHLIEVCQLNQERDKGQIQPPPTGRDLRNTGAWFQRARVVMFVHRDQEIVEGTGARRVLSDGHIRIDKASHGDLRNPVLATTFNPRWLRFESLDDYGHGLAVAA